MLPLLPRLLISDALAATLTVSPGDSIQEAIDNAAAGDTVEVAPGDYDESLFIDKDLTVRGGGATNTTVSTFIGDTVNIEGSPTVVLEGFAFEPGARAVDVRGGQVTLRDLLVEGNSVFDRPGAALRAHPGTEVVIEDCTFADNESTFWPGGSIYAESAVLVLSSSVVRGGSAPEGGNLFAVDSEVTLDGVEISDGNAEFGAGIFVEGGRLEMTAVSLVDNRVRTQFADPDGGGLFADGAEVVFDGGEVRGNRGGVTGGGMRLESSDATLSGVFFSDNEASFGGAVYVDRGAFTASSSFFEDNHATDGAGGAIRWRQDGGRVELDGSLFQSNTATDDGGGVAVSSVGAGGELVMVANRFVGNESEGVGGAVAFEGQALAELSGNLFCANHAAAGGGLFASGDGLLLTFNDFVGNLGDDEGGGMLLDDVVDAGVFQNDFLDNRAIDGGGAFTTYSSVTFLNNLVMGNEGTGLSAVATTGELDYSLFWDNSPDDLSAALAAAAGPGVVFADPELTGFSPDGDCDNDDLTPALTSPAIDAGDPSVNDPGGSRSDIGSVVDQTTTPVDLDGDGVPTPDDCDDTDNTVFPGAVEDCTDVDRDCTGDPYDAAVAIDYFLDADDDGYGNPLDSVSACEPPPGYVADSTDCRDDNPEVNPAAAEVCNGQDDDCDDVVDDGLTTVWYPDNDGDGFGAGASLTQCDAPAGYVDVDGDCDDDDPTIYPGAPDPDGDGVDANCDGGDGTVVTDPGTGTNLSTDDGGPGGSATDAEGFKASGNCGCSAAGGTSWAWLAVVGLVAARRRR